MKMRARDYEEQGEMARDRDAWRRKKPWPLAALRCHGRSRMVHPHLQHIPSSGLDIVR